MHEQVTKLGTVNAKLERSLAKLGTKADTEDFRRGLEKDMKDANSRSRSLVDEIKAYKGADRKKLANEFSREWKRFQGLNTQINAKSQATVRVMEKKEGKASMSLAVSPGAMSGSELSSASSPGGLSEQQMQEEEAGIEFVEYDVEQIENRHARILQIERDVVEVNHMFKDLQLLVDEQGVQLDVAAENIASTKSQTEDALVELRKAEELNKAARRRQCFLLLAVLIVLGIVGGVAGGVIGSA